MSWIIQHIWEDIGNLFWHPVNKYGNHSERGEVGLYVCFECGCICFADKHDILVEQWKALLLQEGPFLCVRGFTTEMQEKKSAKNETFQYKMAHRINHFQPFLPVSSHKNCTSRRDFLWPYWICQKTKLILSLHLAKIFVGSTWKITKYNYCCACSISCLRKTM